MMERILEQEEICIFGAGRVARLLIQMIAHKARYSKIKRIIVSNTKNNPLVLYGIPVVEMNSAFVENKDIPVLVATFENLHGEISKTLEKSGYRNIVYLKDTYIEQLIQTYEGKRSELGNYEKRYVIPYMENYSLTRNAENPLSRKHIYEEFQKICNKEEQDLRIPRMVVVLSTRCSLRCKECNNLMPHFRPAFDLDAEVIKKSLQRIFELSAYIAKLELIGGEPFLASNLENVLGYVLQRDKIGQIEITTNGTVVPRKQELIELLQNERVVVRISDYGDVVNQQGMIRFCVENGIRYMVMELGSWISPGGVDKRNKSLEGLRKQYESCSSGYICKTLYEDKVFACARAASLYALGYMREEEYVQITEKTSEKDIKDFILREYSIACDYCDMFYGTRKEVVPAEQIE